MGPSRLAPADQSLSLEHREGGSPAIRVGQRHRGLWVGRRCRPVQQSMIMAMTASVTAHAR